MVDVIIEICSSVLLFLSVILIAATFKANNIKNPDVIISGTDIEIPPLN